MFSKKITLGIFSTLSLATASMYASAGDDSHQGVSLTHAGEAGPTGALVSRGQGTQIDLTTILPRVASISHTVWCPNERKLSFVADNKYLWVLDTQTGVARLLDTLSLEQQQGPHFAWSEDGRWLHYGLAADQGMKVKHYTYATNRTYSDMPAARYEHESQELIASAQ